MAEQGRSAERAGSVEQRGVKDEEGRHFVAGLGRRRPCRVLEQPEITAEPHEVVAAVSETCRVLGHGRRP